MTNIARNLFKTQWKELQLLAASKAFSVFKTIHLGVLGMIQSTFEDCHLRQKQKLSRRPTQSTSIFSPSISDKHNEHQIVPPTSDKHSKHQICPANIIVNSLSCQHLINIVNIKSVLPTSDIVNGLSCQHQANIVNIKVFLPTSKHSEHQIYPVNIRK